METLRPHFLCLYLYELAGEFSTFYNADKVIVAEPRGPRPPAPALRAHAPRPRDRPQPARAAHARADVIKTRLPPQARRDQPPPRNGHAGILHSRGVGERGARALQPRAAHLPGRDRPGHGRDALVRRRPGGLDRDRRDRGPEGLPLPREAQAAHEGEGGHAGPPGGRTCSPPSRSRRCSRAPRGGPPRRGTRRTRPSCRPTPPGSGCGRRVLCLVLAAAGELLPAADAIQAMDLDKILDQPLVFLGAIDLLHGDHARTRRRGLLPRSFASGPRSGWDCSDSCTITQGHDMPLIAAVGGSRGPLHGDGLREHVSRHRRLAARNRGHGGDVVLPAVSLTDRNAAQRHRNQARPAFGQRTSGRRRSSRTARPGAGSTPC